ncbi:unnamed protein product (macronuclear) [Paramecium tetraurelia]|uniref:Uncharacterized protein n=1 Tax=Paramecium tetraurelia TaxID=5888 RepID=A0DPS3_PARTE|nr:uncharacterized protein GSPATT00019222001 [Paramecium tetraurelia]CAK85040.1 unnamed protein product [Paramecium tetraurelia]|eukprot:XP_001452437.1 hypothetical protein (macronuclear) [Paramecium tetraurelia strain d4-2]
MGYQQVVVELQIKLLDSGMLQKAECYSNRQIAGSQVCNLMFSKMENEFISTHGYSQNQIILWKCNGMKRIATLVGHTSRVLYLAMSPDGYTIVTGAGDETLRFWSIYTQSMGNQQNSKCQLAPHNISIR